MTNLRSKAVAALTAVALLSASAIATPAAAGTKTDIAKAIVGGLVVGAIIGASANAQPNTVIVQEPRHRRHVGNRFGGGFQPVSVGFQSQNCFTQEEVTIDRWGNRASSIRQICR